MKISNIIELDGMVCLQGDYEDISYFEVMYSLVGVFVIHIALTGKKYF